jgi:hypothetical protein
MDFFHICDLRGLLYNRQAGLGWVGLGWIGLDWIFFLHSDRSFLFPLFPFSFFSSFFFTFFFPEHRVQPRYILQIPLSK